MDRKVVLNAKANDVLDWLYAWCYEKLGTEKYKKFTSPSLLRNFLIENHYVNDFQEKIQKFIPDDLIIPSDIIAESLAQKLLTENILLEGEFSNLRPYEKRLLLLVNAQYSLVAASRPPEVCQENVHIFLFKCHRVGRTRTQVQVTCAVPEVEWILDDLWQDMGFVFQVESNSPVSEPQSVVPSSEAGDQQTARKQKGGPQRGMIQPGTIQKLERVREIREEAIRNHRSIPTKQGALSQADLSFKTLQRHDPLLMENWRDANYRPDKRQNLE